MQNPQIGGIWIIHLCAAPNKETEEFQSSKTDWDTVSDIARRQLDILGKESNNNCNNHVVDKYQNRLKYLGWIGDNSLKAAKLTKNAEDTPDSAATTSISTRKPTSGHEQKE
ncbi:uncharacterized protein N7515_001274 [Penicillium bovifimosum]|uniref:Uncharacterized protein n=1 Tax=Penicillium bovifimosum TaxID=126998 RepID=A0A9W9L8M2_9EURO|nr:uncharacterized protein N7515_001274 [Penicillium bovifimosum]KAJ5142487.1 hypothetical protein N7515_001274 [Penicillium bovifimosum]